MINILVEAYPITEERMSGIGHMTLELIKALDRHPLNGKKYTISVIATLGRKNQIRRWGFKNVKEKYIPLPTRIFNGLWKYDLLPPMDILYGRGVYLFPNYKNWKLARSKAFTFICDIGYLLYPQFVSPLNQQFLEKNMAKWINRSSKIIAISKNSEKEIIEHLSINSEKLMYVPCGVDTTTFNQRSKDEIETVKKDCGIKQKYILYIGNIEPRKNILNLIAAYKQLSDQIRAEHALVLVGGGGWLNEPILEEIKQSQQNGYDIITPDHYIADEMLPALFSGASALVHPAVYEGFGISPLQAMACGTPVAVSNASSMPEVVGDAGLFFDPEDPRDIAKQLQQLLTNNTLREELIIKGKERVKIYSWISAADQLLQGILGNSNAEGRQAQ